MSSPLMDGSKEWMIHIFDCKMSNFAKGYTKFIFQQVDNFIKNEMKLNERKNPHFTESELTLYANIGLEKHNHIIKLLKSNANHIHLMNDFEKNFPESKLQIHDAHFLFQKFYTYIIKAPPPLIHAFYSEKRIEELKSEFWKIYVNKFHQEAEFLLGEFFQAEILDVLGTSSKENNNKFEIKPSLQSWFYQVFSRIHNFSLRTSLQNLPSCLEKEIVDELMHNVPQPQPSPSSSEKKYDSSATDTIVLDFVSRKLESLEKQRKQDLERLEKQRDEDLKRINQEIIKQKEILVNIQQKWTAAVMDLNKTMEQRFQNNQLSFIEMEKNLQVKLASNIQNNWENTLMFLKDEIEAFSENLDYFIRQLKQQFPEKGFDYLIEQSDEEEEEEEEEEEREEEEKKEVTLSSSEPEKQTDKAN